MKWQRRGGRRGIYALLIVLLLGGYIYWAAHRPLPTLQPSTAQTRIEVVTQASRLQWPAKGQSAVGVVGSSILETHGPQTPLAIASTAKLITALAVLHNKPLTLNQPGPTLTLDATDVASYNNYANAGGSVIRVTAGEQISEYQVLQTMLLPSANNMADSLARWAFGSVNAYDAYANKYVKQLGLQDTHVGSDASGFSSTTTSTAHDLVRLGELVMQQPVLAQIVGQQEAGNIPNVGTIKNVNFLLGSANVVGIKTGNTDQAGGVFVSASRTQIANRPVTIVTALVGAPTLFEALADSVPLLQSAQTNFQTVNALPANSIVGHYRVPWGSSLTARTTSDARFTAWNGSAANLQITLNRLPAAARAGQTVGNVRGAADSFGNQQSVPVELQNSVPHPSLWWRLLHPLTK